MITVNDSIELSFSITYYLEQYLPGHFEQSDGHWLKGCCLFHDDTHPSMHVNTETGGYHCFSCGAKGNVVRLVQRISQFRTYHDALDWLVDRYGVGIERDELTLRFSESAPPVDAVYAGESVATQYLVDHNPYMTDVRGIPAEVLRMFDVGHCKQSNSVTIPWRDRHGRLLTVKHRSVVDKRFFYEPKCRGLRNHVWGLHHAVGQPIVYVCEAEIDAMTLWAAGKVAVAIGGSHLNEHQARELLLAGVQTVVATCDRDDAGRQANQQLKNLLSPLGMDVVDAVWPDTDAKDCNQLGVDGCRQITYELPKISF